MITICMLQEQAENLIDAKSFQIDLSFKRVSGEIKEFEFNSYDEFHHKGIFLNIIINLYI